MDSFEEIFEALVLAVADISKVIVKINEVNDQTVATN